jgi:hypothetical protein
LCRWHSAFGLARRRPANPARKPTHKRRIFVRGAWRAANHLATRLREQFRRDDPQALDLADGLGADRFLDLMELAPTPADATRDDGRPPARTSPHPSRRRRPTSGRARCGSASPTVTSATPAPGSTPSAPDAPRRKPSPGPPSAGRDATILRSLPDAGRVVFATRLAEAAEPLQWRDRHALRSPRGRRTRQPTQRQAMRRPPRQACQRRLRIALCHGARIATQRDARSRVRCNAFRQRGHTRGSAFCSVADRCRAVAGAMLRTGAPSTPAPS